MTTASHRRPRARALACGIGLLLVLAACGGDDEASSDGDRPDDSTDGGSSNNSATGDSGSSDDGGRSIDQDGFVTVEGTTYAFTYDNFGRCGVEADAGSIVSFGNLVDDLDRQVTFTYGLPEEMDSGEPLMQVIVMSEDGQQMYYSAVGYPGLDPVGAVESIERDGATVRITGQLRKVADQSLVDFEGEATCDQ